MLISTVSLPTPDIMCIYTLSQIQTTGGWGREGTETEPTYLEL